MSADGAEENETNASETKAVEDSEETLPSATESETVQETESTAEETQETESAESEESQTETEDEYAPVPVDPDDLEAPAAPASLNSRRKALNSRSIWQVLAVMMLPKRVSGIS